MTLISATTSETHDKILTCRVCGADGYLHQAINDIENPVYIVDCTKYDKGKGHNRVPIHWYHCKEDAILSWNLER